MPPRKPLWQKNCKPQISVATEGPSAVRRSEKAAEHEVANHPSLSAKCSQLRYLEVTIVEHDPVEQKRTSPGKDCACRDRLDVLQKGSELTNHRPINLDKVDRPVFPVTSDSQDMVWCVRRGPIGNG
jgi:hypothetical protein